ncbi:hypothetical protein M3Y97_00534400 [Aphelenchoides bicaudatus]|nr:hypothetical protein M3Y97_00534400 [Aphelenchoides bicaudatus]
MSDPVDCIDSRFSSILKLDRPLSPVNVNTLKRDHTYVDKEGAVALVQYIFLEDVWKSFFKCLANNISKPMRSNEEAYEMSQLEQERDVLAREHYILRKKNLRSNAIVEKFQENFQAFHDKQSRVASEIYNFAENLRTEHLQTKNQLASQIDETKACLEEQRKANAEMLEELKALKSEVGALSDKFNQQDLNTLDKKIDQLVRGSRLSNVGASEC